MVMFQNVKLENHRSTQLVVFNSLGNISQRSFACGPEISLLIRVLAILFVAWIYKTANAITFSSRMTVACVTLWDSASPGNLHGWMEGERQKALDTSGLAPRGQRRGKEREPSSCKRRQPEQAVEWEEEPSMCVKHRNGAFKVYHT